jgi:hypothetical protein
MLTIFDDSIRAFGYRTPLRKRPAPMGGVLRAKFDRAKLEEAIDYVLGDGGKVEVVDVPRPLVATCATTKSPFVMTNISGVAYAPDLVAVGEVLADARASLETLRLLSIGTAGPDPASVPTDIGRRGLGRWLIGDLPPLTLEAQERIVVRQVSARGRLALISLRRKADRRCLLASASCAQ